MKSKFLTITTPIIRARHPSRRRALLLGSAKAARHRRLSSPPDIYISKPDPIPAQKVHTAEGRNDATPLRASMRAMGGRTDGPAGAAYAAARRTAQGIRAESMRKPTVPELALATCPPPMPGAVATTTIPTMPFHADRRTR
jgi:hypothetical protein